MTLNPARYWREIPQRYRYEAGKCDGSGSMGTVPARRSLRRGLTDRVGSG